MGKASKMQFDNLNGFSVPWTPPSHAGGGRLSPVKHRKLESLMRAGYQDGNHDDWLSQSTKHPVDWLRIMDSSSTPYFLGGQAWGVMRCIIAQKHSCPSFPFC